MKLDPLKIWPMEVDKFIEANNLLEVTSPFIHVSSSTDMDPDGLFSERIFGPIATPLRMVKMGYISLGCKVFHPIVYQALIALKRFYGEIMAAKTYAKWDPVERDFIRANEQEDGADTGFTFFLSHFNQIQFNRNSSLKRNDRIEMLVKYKDRLFIDKCIVSPAGIRDFSAEDGRLEKDSINTLYIGLLERAKSMPPGGADDPIYDAIHYAIQKRVLEIYEYLQNFVRGKSGYFQSRFASRSVAQGTRNVITSSSMVATDPSSPQYHKQDEVKVPLFQAAKGYASLVIYWLKSIFYGNIIQQGADQIPLIDPDSYALVYMPIDDKDKDALLTSEGILKTIDRFRDVEYRWRPVTAIAMGKTYFLFLVYDDGKEIAIIRNLEEFKTIFKNIRGAEPDKKFIRPLTYAEMMYIATYQASLGKFGTITRYPVTDEQSIFPAKTHLVSTSPSRIVTLLNTQTGGGVILPEYPVMGGRFLDVLMFHPSKRAGLTADYDGNCLVGSTKLQIRYNPLWLVMIEELDYSVSGQNVDTVVSALKRDVYINRSELTEIAYASVRFDEMPQPGPFALDKNGAKVYDIPPGCEVLTLENGIPCWRPFDKITVEEDCEYRKIKVGGRFAEVSTNPSVAIFDYGSGQLKKVTPIEAEGKFAPTIIKDISPYGKIGTYMDGWFLGAMVSDGYLEDRYLGYTKLDELSRSKVVAYIKSKIGDDVVFKEYTESPETGANKLAKSISLHFTDARVKAWAETFDMYSDTPRNALTKRISMKHLMNGTREFLVGLFAGLMDGDGTITRDKDTGTIAFRLSTSSRALVESVKVLAYKLGIRYGVSVMPPRNWSKEAYVVLFNASDSVGIRDELVCFEPTNVLKLEMWKMQHVRVCTDMLPLSESERKTMVDVVRKHGDTLDLNYFRYRKLDDGFMRSKFHKYLEWVEDLNIVHRVKCWSVHWDKVKLVGDVSRATVYDILVPSSKVFAVNNGLIVYDTVSWIPILGEDANEECERYVHDVSNYVFPNGTSQIGTDDLIDITLRAMTCDPT